MYICKAMHIWQQLGTGPSLNYCRCGFNRFCAKDNK